MDSKREELKKKLKNKIKEQETLRSNKVVKEEIVDNNLKNLGINSMDELKTYMDSIKDIDKAVLMEQLTKMGITKEQLEQFYKFLGK
jgi:hypothetical protein